MKIVICEDELIIAEYIRECCLELGFRVVGIAKNKEEGIFLVASEKPTLVLLDINLGSPRAGIEIAEYIQRQQAGMLFLYITASNDWQTMEEAIRTKPQGYLVKPLDKDTLIANLLLAKFKQTSQPALSTPSVGLPTESGTKSVQPQHLLYVASDGNYCELYDVQGQRRLERVSLSQVEQSLKDQLLRIHKSYLVNPRHVIRFSSQKVYLSNGAELPVGRKFKANIALFLDGKPIVSEG